jgi:xanthine/uracil permease
MLSGVPFSRRNMLIMGVSIAVAIGLRGQEALYAGAPTDVQAILHSGLVPGAILSIVLNLVLPGRAENDRQ